MCYDINLFNRYSTFFVHLFDSLNLSFLQILEEVEGDKYFVQFNPIGFFFYLKLILQLGCVLIVEPL